MDQPSSYIGFSKPPEIDELIDALINDPPDIRWRVVRTLLRIEDQAKLTEIPVAPARPVRPIRCT